MSEIIVTPLGTVSPYTKDNMNCPGYLINYNNQRILLDCGNGITRLLNFPDDLENLHVIVTHYHKDHFGDLGALQYASFVYHNLGLIKDKIKIYLPKNEYGFNKASILSNKDSYAEYIDIDDKTRVQIDDLTISFEDNHSHTIESFMVKLENGEKKVIYTSDIGTTNFNGLVEFCRDADLIICESSFLERHNANSKTHMTAFSASLLASNANAKELLLTHFWPEEDKTLYLEEAKRGYENVSVAEEGKSLVLSPKGKLK